MRTATVATMLVVFFGLAGAAFGDPLACNLSGYRAAAGLTATAGTKKWVRFAAWDSAGNGAMVQPQKLGSNAADRRVN